MTRSEAERKTGSIDLSLTVRPGREQDDDHAMTTNTAPATTSPLETARALAPRIRERAAEIEEARQLPADLVMDLANARLFKVAVPEAEGGLGADIMTALQVIEEVARATVRLLAGWPKMPGERDCYARFMKEWINN